MPTEDPRRQLPSVARLVQSARKARPDLPVWAITEAARELLTRARQRITEAAGSPGPPTGLEAVVAAAEERVLPHPRRVVNATGIVLHTNLGRAPLPAGAARAAAEAAAVYSNLELDLATGRRGRRLSAVADKLRQIAAVPGATACNNNAAAVLWVLDTLARGREVIVSRGELVEIGGSFRVPDILERAGVRLVEVGTTNRTHARDYERAIGPDTALLLKVHRSNFTVSGFTKEVSLPELAAIGRGRGLPVVEDLGSGTLVDLSGRGLPKESYAPDRVREGADLVCFSGDKLMGGPQAGIVLGRADLVAALDENPLARALRLDKLSLAALDWCLAALLDGRATTEFPVVRALTTPAEVLAPRARALADALEKSVPASLEIGWEPESARVGGGSLPEVELDTWVVTVRGTPSPEALARELRRAPVPVLARVRDDALRLDVRTFLDGDDALVVDAVVAAARCSADSHQVDSNGRKSC
ncbi:MAG: L-seryl-tRNA(Sec) selenium transferase [Proteobacteria bacterium]|nr:L-seryl-tRNA(Sec) selenium transferase [Pseudomonadota bacterium]